jgi:arylformamidase
MGRIIDVSMDVFSGMLVWPGDDGVDLRRVRTIGRNVHANVSRIRFGVHTGTHVDAPLHFVPGAKSIEQIPLDVLAGPAWVAEFPSRRKILAEDLEQAGIPSGTQRLLLKTDNSKILAALKTFREDYAGLDVGGAEWIAARGIRLVGCDFLSVAVREQTGPVHDVLLKAEIVIVEGLLLEKAPAGACTFYCLPLKLRGSDGAPARAMVEID